MADDEQVQLDLRDPSTPVRVEPGAGIGDDGAFELLARALGTHGHPGLPEEPTEGDAEPTSAGPPEPTRDGEPEPDTQAMTVCEAEPPLATTPVHLKRVESLPRSVRRRMGLDLAEGEEVECAILAGRDTGSRWAVATTHRVVVDSPTERSAGESLSLPYHRTSAALGESGTIELRSDEFGLARTATIHAESGFAAETNHLIERVNTA